MSSITFPAISAMVSRNADPDQQGECSGVCPAGAGAGECSASQCWWQGDGRACRCWLRSVALFSVVLTLLSLSTADALGGNSETPLAGAQCGLSEVEKSAASPRTSLPKFQFSWMLLATLVLLSKAASPAILVLVIWC